MLVKTVNQLMNLKGRVALITGGAGHLGFAMAEALAEVGCGIVILDVNEKAALLKAKMLMKKYRVSAIGVKVDLANAEEIATVSSTIKSRMKRLDIVINAAALVGTTQLKGWAVPFAQQNIDTWRLALEVNLTAVFALVQECQPLLAKSSNASIINIASIYGIVGPDMSLYQGSSLGNPAAYAASKGGLVQLTRWMATSLAPTIRVNTISIGGVFRNHQEPFLIRYKNKTPLKRMAIEQDIKGAAVYLASDMSQYVTGHNLIVDGGWSAW